MRQTENPAVKVGMLISLMILLVSAGTVQAVIPVERMFLQNLGQWDKTAKYHMVVGQSRAEPICQLELWLTEKGYVYHITKASQQGDPSSKEMVPSAEGKAQHAVSVSFEGGRKPKIEAKESFPGTYNWLVGNRSRHVIGAKAYRQLVYRGVYPGIDVIFDASSETRMMETTYHVAPGANPDDIRLRYEGADSVRLDASGNLVLATSLGDVTELKPVAFQRKTGGPDEPVSIAFALHGKRLSFNVGPYDRTRPLYIDPVVVFSRTFGGSNTEGVASMHEDATGRYLTGVTASSDFPATSGAYQEDLSSSPDLFAVKFSLDNQTLLWATYLGGTAQDYGGNSALVSDGSLYLVGSTYSAGSWPSNPPTYTYGPRGSSDVGIVHLSSNGQSIIASAVIGGSSYDYVADIGIDGGNVYVCGSSYFPVTNNFPIVAGGYNTTENNDYVAFVLRFNNALSSYLNMTFVPGGTSFDGANGLTFDGSGNVYVYGTTLNNNGGYPSTSTIGPGGNYDLFVAKYNSTLDTQSYNTLIGGSSTEPTAGYSYTIFPNNFYQGFRGIIVDGSNRAWITGMAASSDFPTTPGAYQTTNRGNYDVFVLALNGSGTALVYSTMIGGSSTDAGRAIRFDSLGNVYVAGSSISTDYPTTLGAVQGSNAGNYVFVVSVLSPDLRRLIASTYWGGNSNDFAADLAVGPDYAVRIAGSSIDTFPQVPSGSAVFGPGGSYDGAVVSIADLFSPEASQIPTLDQLGLVVLIGFAGLSSAYYIRRKRREGA